MHADRLGFIRQSMDGIKLQFHIGVLKAYLVGLSFEEFTCYL
jgi:hypothetical protein